MFHAKAQSRKATPGNPPLRNLPDVKPKTRRNRLMKKKIFETAKSLALGVGVIILLQVTGLMSTVSGLTQSAMLEMGVLDASDEPMKKPEAFDFNFAVRKG